MNNTERIAEIRERCAAATPGPWEALIKKCKSFGYIGTPKGVRGFDDLPISDARFVARAREDVPYLLSEVERLERQLEHKGICEICQEKSVLKADEFREERDHWKAQAEALAAELEQTRRLAGENIHLVHSQTKRGDEWRAIAAEWQEKALSTDAELEQKTRELSQIAIESVNREKQLAKLEAEVKIALKTCPNGGNDGYITPRPCQCEMKTAYDETGIPYLIEAEGSEAKHIVELLAAESDGRLVVLPCKLGDIVYGAVSGTKSSALKGKVIECQFKTSMIDDIGKIYFLTRAEAEAALSTEGVSG